MNLSSGSMRTSVMNEPGEDRTEHESKRLRLVGGLFVLSDTMGCVFRDVDVSDGTNATTTN